MEASIETRLPTEIVWKAWERAHSLHAGEGIEPGRKAQMTGFRYKILDVIPQERFSILWKSLFVRMVFIHSVQPIGMGSEIRYSVQIKGFLAWPVRFVLRSKIQRNLSFVLKEFVNSLEKQLKA